MSISDKLVQEALEYLRLEDFMTVLQFSLIDEKSSENSFGVFADFLDKELPVRVAEEGYIGDQLRAHISEVKIALIKTEEALFDTDISKNKIFRQYCLPISGWEDTPLGDLLIKRSDIQVLYQDAYEQTQYPWALTKWPDTEKEWSWFKTPLKTHSTEPTITEQTNTGLNIDLPVLMELLDCESPQDCWLYENCIIEDKGIYAKPITKHTKELLIGDEWCTREQFEQDVRLKLPCSLNDLQDWVSRNGFESVVSDNIKLFKERQIAVAKIKADRAPNSDSNIDELLKKSISSLLSNNGLDKAEEFDRSFQLYLWQDTLNNELKRVKSADYQFEENRQTNKQLIMGRLSEIDFQLYGEVEEDTSDKNTDNHLPKEQRTRKKRQDNLTRAIIAAMVALKRKPSLDDLWQFFTDDRDSTKFIVDYTDDRITWTNTKGNLNDTLKKSLANRLSKLKYPF